jgi:hypothetical protein
MGLCYSQQENDDLSFECGSDSDPSASSGSDSESDENDEDEDDNTEDSDGQWEKWPEELVVGTVCDEPSPLNHSQAKQEQYDQVVDTLCKYRCR